MNKERRKKIEDLVVSLNQALDEIQAIAGEEQEYYDNMPESLQQGDKGQQAEQSAEYLTTAADGLEEVISNLDYSKDA